LGLPVGEARRHVVDVQFAFILENTGVSMHGSAHNPHGKRTNLSFLSLRKKKSLGKMEVSGALSNKFDILKESKILRLALKLSTVLMGCGGFLQLGVMGFEWIDLIQLLYYSPEHLALVGWRFLLQLALTLMGIGFAISPKYLGTTIRTGAIGALITISLTGTLASYHLQALLGFDWLMGIILFGASVLTLIGSIMKYGEIKERLGKSKWTWE